MDNKNVKHKHLGIIKPGIKGLHFYTGLGFNVIEIDGWLYCWGHFLLPDGGFFMLPIIQWNHRGEIVAMMEVI